MSGDIVPQVGKYDDHSCVDDKNNGRLFVFKAMEYAKTVPKPVTSKITQNLWKLPSKETTEKPQTLLAILQQRHEEEKKAINATRKNFQAKYSR